VHAHFGMGVLAAHRLGGFCTDRAVAEGGTLRAARNDSNMLGQPQPPRLSGLLGSAAALQYRLRDAF
jgi:hypothetical protein